MSSFDRESFHLLQMSDSATDSVPDLDLVIPNTNVKKKKVRLKRFVLSYPDITKPAASSPVPFF